MKHFLSSRKCFVRTELDLVNLPLSSTIRNDLRSVIMNSLFTHVQMLQADKSHYPTDRPPIHCSFQRPEDNSVRCSSWHERKSNHSILIQSKYYSYTEL